MSKFSKLLVQSVKLYVVLLVVATAVILYGTLFPVDYDVPKSIIGLDKVVHIIMFGGWTFLYGIVRFLRDKYTLWPVFLVGAIFGVVIELLQHILPTGRNPEMMDMLADFSGTALAILVLYVLSKKVPAFKLDTAS